jgi:hypothetical protein
VSSGVLPPRVALAVALVLTVVFSAAAAIRRLARSWRSRSAGWPRSCRWPAACRRCRRTS